jgi:hypothetical protein
MGTQVNNLLGHKPGGEGQLQFNNIYAPSDGNYDITFYYYCGLNDTNGDGNCGGEPNKPPYPQPPGCRPSFFVVNGTLLMSPVASGFQFPCFAGLWNIVHTFTFSLPLKAGMTNSIKIYSESADAPNFDRIVVADGKGTYSGGPGPSDAGSD